MGKGDDKQRIEYAEISKTVKKKAREDIRKYYEKITREIITTSKSLRKVRGTQKLGQNRLITPLDKQGREIRDHDKITERIQEFYTKLYDREQSSISHTDPKDVPAITSWEVKAALRDMRMGQQEATTI